MPNGGALHPTAVTSWVSDIALMQESRKAAGFAGGLLVE